MTQELIRNLLVTATLAPLFSALLVIFLGKRWMGKAAAVFATTVMAAAFGCSLWAAVLWLSQSNPGTILWNIPWIPIPGSEGGWLYLGAMVDSLTIGMMAMVTGISMLVHLYSIGYMAGDARYERFFAYLSLFTFSMLGIVMANSIIMLFVFWELVGLTSYLLIGFWFEKRGPQLACKKAFVMNRIGDMGFLIGFGILFYQLGGRLLLPMTDGSLFATIVTPVAQGGLGLEVTNPPMWLTAAGIGLFFGAIGKSAQFPLHTWLPDAMEGPTPVSSIVHSATMVAAGVYLTARIYPILTPSAHLFISVIGLITLVIAACMALVMTDIKRVLAYSTLSQLGYMILGLGTGGYAFALFHLMTHAFFKCCLFQCAGSVIHAAHHQQDMRYYGGLWKKMPVTAACYGICTLAIAGASLPFVSINGFPIGISGFYSKDGLIAGAAGYAQAMADQGWWAAPLFYYGPLIVAYLTAFYMARSFALTFLGKPRDPHLYDHAHEAPATMLIPQVALAAMSILAIPMMLPLFDLILASTPRVSYLQPTFDKLPTFAWIEHHLMAHGFHQVHVGLLYGFAWLLMLAIGTLIYLPGMAISGRIASLPLIRLFYTWALNKFYFDALYDVFAVNMGKLIAWVASSVDRFIVDGLVNLAGLAGQGAAWLSGWFDRRVIDASVDGAANLAQTSGEMLRQTQVGRIRVYVTLLAVAMCVAAAAVILGVVVLTRG